MISKKGRIFLVQRNRINANRLTHNSVGNMFKPKNTMTNFMKYYNGLLSLTKPRPSGFINSNPLTDRGVMACA